MSPDQRLALCCFLAGMAAGFLLSAYLEWCDRREAARRAKEPVVD